MNIFSNTSFKLKEEDRMTNALLCIFEHTDRTVFKSLLEKITDFELSDYDLDNIRFNPQESFPHSRPDAFIRVGDCLDIYIETKRGKNLDNGQFKRHYLTIQGCTRKTILLALTAHRNQPEFVENLAKQNSNKHLEISFLSWHECLKLICELQEGFEKESKTKFLLEQMENYLKSHNYWYFDGVKMDDLFDYGNTLNKLYLHENKKKTQDKINSFLENLKHFLEPKTEGFNWQRDYFKNNVSETQVNFGFLNSKSKSSFKINYRISIEWKKTENSIRIMYYLTFHNKKHMQDNLVKLLDERKSDVEGFSGGTDHYGYIGTEDIYHIRIHLDESDVYSLFENKQEVEKITDKISSFFIRLEKMLCKLKQDNNEIANK